MRAAALALAVAAVLAPMAQAEPLVLDATAMRQLADKAIDAGFGADALEILDALLLRDPADATALILRSQALRLLGRYAEAETAARAGYATADSDAGRFGAAMVLAQALSLQDRRIEAQLWLRRAAQDAPSDRLRALAERDFDLVRAATPLTLSFALSLTPSSNVNNGARDPVFELPGGYICPTGCLGEATGAALALSGLQGAVGAGAQYRWHDSQTAQGVVSATLSHGFVVLSPDAMALAPASRAGDFAVTSLDFGLSESRYAAGSGAIYKLALNAGRVWYGGTPLSDYAAAEISVTLPVSESLTLNGAMSRQVQASAVSGDLTGRLSDGSFGAQLRLTGGDMIGAEVSAGLTQAPSVFSENQRQSVSLRWQAGQPVWGLGLSAKARLSALRYDTSLYSFDGRQDLGANLSVSAEVEALDYMGFVPVITLEADRNWSDIGLYDSQTFGVGIGVTSKF